MTQNLKDWDDGGNARRKGKLGKWERRVEMDGAEDVCLAFEELK